MLYFFFDEREVEVISYVIHKLVLSLRNLHHGWWQAVLSDGTEQIVITISAVPQEPLLPMLWAVRLLLLGANESRCIWWTEPGQYRWLFSRTEKQLHIQIIWFNDTRDWSDEKGETFLRTECDLLTFAKRLSHQLDQLEYQEGRPAVDKEEHQKLKEAITAFKRSNLSK